MEAVERQVRGFFSVARVRWPSPAPEPPAGADALVGNPLGQPTIWRPAACALSRGVAGTPDSPPLLCDFGRELHGGLQIIVRDTTGNRPARLRVTFGESVAEALGTPNQDHAIHQHVVDVPWAGMAEVGNTGFRFARLDLVDDGSMVELSNVRAVTVESADPWVGAFECSDARLNDVWRVGARTVQLCVQEHLWDGIKRDRLIWAGDLHPETMAILHLFGGHPVVPRSLNFVRDETPVGDAWMNGMPTYSLWWVITWRDWLLHTGDQAAIEANRSYLTQLLDRLVGLVADDGREQLPARFLDWSMASDDAALSVGAHALMRLALTAGAELCRALAEANLADRCASAAGRLTRWPAPPSASQQANGLRVLAGLADAVETNRTAFAPNPMFNLSPFYGYYVLEARALAGDHAGCLGLIRRYWGGMLDFGATTFWEHFDAGWIDHDPPYVGLNDWPVPGRPNVHGDTGDHCYKGFRHSLCHGWSAGPTAWLARHVLGVVPTAAGFARVRVRPTLAGLEWARGTVPTPFGPIRVSHERAAGGEVRSRVEVPEGVLLE